MIMYENGRKKGIADDSGETDVCGEVKDVGEKVTLYEAMATFYEAMATFYEAMVTFYEAMVTVYEAIATVYEAMVTVSGEWATFAEVKGCDGEVMVTVYTEHATRSIE